MTLIKAKKIPKTEITSGDILSQLCYYFPQYNYQQARKLPYKRVLLLLKAAEKENAKRMIDLLRITLAPHVKRKSFVSNLFNEFRDRMK